MANLSPDDVLKLARLSRLHIENKDIPKYQKEINAILNYVEMLQSVDVFGLEPTYQVTGLSDVMRKDEVRDYAQTPSDLLKNVPYISNGQIKVKRVL